MNMTWNPHYSRVAPGGGKICKNCLLHKLSDKSLCPISEIDSVTVIVRRNINKSRRNRGGLVAPFLVRETCNFHQPQSPTLLKSRGFNSRAKARDHLRRWLTDRKERQSIAS